MMAMWKGKRENDDCRRNVFDWAVQDPLLHHVHSGLWYLSPVEQSLQAHLTVNDDRLIPANPDEPVIIGL
jgi:hypothetical protein